MVKFNAPWWPVPPPSDGVAAVIEAAAAVSPLSAGGRVPPWSTPIYEPASTESQLARRYRLTPEVIAAEADRHTRALYGSDMYRSVEQKRAIYAVLSARDAVTQLVVLPTAGGQDRHFDRSRHCRGGGGGGGVPAATGCRAGRSICRHDDADSLVHPGNHCADADAGHHGQYCRRWAGRRPDCRFVAARM